MPIMPHIALGPQELDRLYPPLIPADEVDDPDLNRDDDDGTFAAGMAIAAKIGADMVTLGRTRREGQVRENGVGNGAPNGANTEGIEEDAKVVRFCGK